ncbi:hypothetical protein [Thermodesulfitimonas autotrophica]|uniref:hypothetical protein n=1 Tax=Thermodesulfitimonas autotrophica TaxID=1894989 RepID=UPI002FE031A0
MRQLLDRPRREILLVFAVAKVFQGVFVYAGYLLRGPLPPQTWPGVANWWLNPWTTYDSQWYLEIAARGYRELTAPFFPLYPLWLKICGHTDVTRALAGVIISNLAFLLALYFLRRLTQEDYDTPTARAVVWVAAFYPTAAVFGAVYTEALFLLFLVLAFTTARREKWAAAGFWGLLAGATRNSGPVVFAALLLDYLHARRYRLKALNLKPVLFLSLTLAGPLLFGLYLYFQFSDPLLSLKSQHHFYRVGFAWPWQPLCADLKNFCTGRNPNAVIPINLLFLSLIGYWVIRRRRALRPAYLFLLLGVVLMHLCYPRANSPHTIGLIRYLSVLFPFLQILAAGYVAATKKVKGAKILLPLAYFLVNAFFAFGFGLKSFLE